MRVSAVAKGLAPDLQFSFANRIFDHDWRVDFGKLFEFAGGKDKGRAVLYGSRPPANDSLWSIAKNKGFEVVSFTTGTSPTGKRRLTQQ